MEKTEPIKLLNAFCKPFTESIYPIYKQHEETFDVDGIHGVLHIGRSIIAAYMLANKCNELGLNTNIEDVLIATAFHDSGRKNGGDDHWESISAINCAAFINEQELKYGEQITVNSAHHVSSHIIKHGTGLHALKTYSLDFLCVHDSDCLEIMRPSTGRGGRDGFDKSFLFLNHYNNDLKFFFNQFINDWWAFIQETERYKKEFSNPTCLADLIDFIQHYPAFKNYKKWF